MSPHSKMRPSRGRDVLSKLGENVKLAGVSRIVMVIAGLIGPAAGSVCAWGISSVFRAQDELKTSTKEIQLSLAGAEARDMRRDDRIAHIEAFDDRLLVANAEHDKAERVVFDDHARRIGALELAQLAAQEARLKALEEPQVTRRLNHREAIKR